MLAFTVNQFVKYSYLPDPGNAHEVRSSFGVNRNAQTAFDEYTEIVDSGFFEVPDLDFESVVVEEEPGPETEISDLHLIGTITGPYSVARAIIRKGRRTRRPRRRSRRTRRTTSTTQSENGTDIYKLWSDVYGYKLVRIAGSKVYLKANDKVEVLDMFGKEEEEETRTKSRSFGGSSSSKLSRTISRAEIQQQVFNSVDKALKGLRAGPYRVNGKIEGYKLFRVRPSNILYKYGARSGDIVKRVNGHKVDSTEKLLSMWSSVKSESRIQVDIKRGSKILQFDFNITD